jgi:hypothetical protein
MALRTVTGKRAPAGIDPDMPKGGTRSGYRP